MTKSIRINDIVSVPRIRCGLDVNDASAMYTGKVVELSNRSARVELPNGDISGLIPVSAIQRNVKLMIIKIGDFDSEYTLLNPLQKSVLQYCRLLLNDDEVVSYSLRTSQELETIWSISHSIVSHVILIGHGRKNGIKFGKIWLSPLEIDSVLSVGGVEPKQFISLCCKTGYSDFGKAFSRFSYCETLISPFQSIHGSIASQFCQTYLAYHLLRGQTTGIAFKNARESVPGAVNFRLWKNARLIAGKKT